MKETEVRQQIRWGLTKYGGYREIPEELIKECAEKVGLEEIPEVYIVRGKEEAWSGWNERTNKPAVIIMRREAKWAVPYSLCHEFGHIKLGHVIPEGVDYDKAWKTTTGNDLAVQKLLGDGELFVGDLFDVAVAYVIREGRPKSQVVSIVMKEAEKLGASKNVITRARKWLNSFWKDVEWES